MVRCSHLLLHLSCSASSLSGIEQTNLFELISRLESFQIRFPENLSEGTRKVEYFEKLAAVGRLLASDRALLKGAPK